MSEQMTTLVKSYAKTFLATVLALFLADGADVFAVDTADLRTWLAAGIASVVPLVITALDPRDARFGRGASSNCGSDADSSADLG